MPALDTNVLVRDIVRDDPSQRAAAERFVSRCVAEGSTLFVNATVLLELEWVLRSGCAFAMDDMLMTLSSLFFAADLTFESEHALEVALQLSARMPGSGSYKALEIQQCGRKQRSAALQQLCSATRGRSAGPIGKRSPAAH